MKLGQTVVKSMLPDPGVQSVTTVLGSIPVSGIRKLLAVESLDLPAFRGNPGNYWMISPVDRLSGRPFRGHGNYQIGPWQAVGIDEFKGYANQSRGDVGITPFVAPPGL